MADLLKRFLQFKGFAVNHIMNITDVGHLLDDADEGADKLEEAARKEKKDPLEMNNLLGSNPDKPTWLAQAEVMKAHLVEWLTAIYNKRYEKGTIPC